MTTAPVINLADHRPTEEAAAPSGQCASCALTEIKRILTDTLDGQPLLIDATIAAEVLRITEGSLATIAKARQT